MQATFATPIRASSEQPNRTPFSLRRSLAYRKTEAATISGAPLPAGHHPAGRCKRGITGRPRAIKVRRLPTRRQGSAAGQFATASVERSTVVAANAVVARVRSVTETKYAGCTVPRATTVATACHHHCRTPAIVADDRKRRRNRMAQRTLAKLRSSKG
jgi:hypothetical protein